MGEEYCRKIVFQFIFGLGAGKFEQLEKNYSQHSQNHFHVVRQNNFRTFCLEWTNSAQVFWSLSKTIGLLAWYFCRISQNCSLRLQRNISRIFLERRVIVWSFSVTERKKPSFGEKIIAGLLKVHFTYPQQNFEKKMIKVIYTIIIFFRTLSEFFSDFGKKIFRCVETVI